ncbi:MAG: hypothetical protein AB7V41_02730 [Burkholderiaceae bacterium]
MAALADLARVVFFGVGFKAAAAAEDAVGSATASVSGFPFFLAGKVVLEGMAGFVDFVADMRKTSESKNNQDGVKCEGACGTNKEIIDSREKPGAAKTRRRRRSKLTCTSPNKARTPSSM